MSGVKIFDELSTYTLELAINQWIQDAPRIKIRAIRQSSNQHRTVVSVWYDEEEDLPKALTPQGEAFPYAAGPPADYGRSTKPGFRRIPPSASGDRRVMS